MQSTQKNQVYMGGGTWKQLTSEDNCPGPWASTYRLGPLVERPARIASMGPPPFGDGNMAEKILTAAYFSILQWGHRPSAMETRLEELAGRYGTASFNGATALRRWKRVTIELELLVLFEPSMGPPPFGDGNRYLGLNSALSPWGCVNCAAQVSIIHSLPSLVRLKTASLWLIRCERCKARASTSNLSLGDFRTTGGV